MNITLDYRDVSQRPFGKDLVNILDYRDVSFKPSKRRAYEHLGLQGCLLEATQEEDSVNTLDCKDISLKSSEKRTL